MSLAAGKRDHKEQNPKQLTRPGEFLVVPIDTCFPSRASNASGCVAGCGPACRARPAQIFGDWPSLFPMKLDPVDGALSARLWEIVSKHVVTL